MLSLSVTLFCFVSVLFPCSESFPSVTINRSFYLFQTDAVDLRLLRKKESAKKKNEDQCWRIDLLRSFEASPVFFFFSYLRFVFMALQASGFDLLKLSTRPKPHC